MSVGLATQPLWLVTENGIDVALVAAEDGRRARIAARTSQLHPDASAERVGTSRPGADGVVKWIRDPGATPAAPSPRLLVREAVAASARAIGINPANAGSRSSIAARARWAAWLALAERMSPSTIARGMGMDHSTVHAALPKARALLQSGDKHMSTGYAAALASLPAREPTTATATC